MQVASYTQTVWISSTGVKTTRWDGQSMFYTSIIKICRYCGQYLVGHAFATNPDLENIIFQVCCSPGYCYTLCQGSNSTGQTLRAKGKERLMRWLDFRGRFGFSEFNADTYGPISFAPLVTVAALAPDPEVPTPQLAYFFFIFLGEDPCSDGTAPPDL